MRHFLKTVALTGIPALILTAIAWLAFQRGISPTHSPAATVDKAPREERAQVASTVRDIAAPPKNPRASPSAVGQATATGASAASPGLLVAIGPSPGSVAREALSYVGTNPAAEIVWLEAINDPSTPPHVRKDLIEDLNTDGFENALHPTLADLFLIQNRLELIEKYAPATTDPTNYAAFQEAKKDLIKMLRK